LLKKAGFPSPQHSTDTATHCKQTQALLSRDR
jgi:hypothetical protein